MESFSTGAQNYRHQFLVHSTDGGMTWNADEACDLTPDEDFDGYEAVFGSIAPDVVNGQLEIIYQRDFEPVCTSVVTKIQQTSMTSSLARSG